jgi:Xaa-Pro aminopeptidase
MAYYEIGEQNNRIEKVKRILEEKNLDFAFVYYDECNLANGWYLTAWSPQFESGAVLVSRNGDAMILGGPESEPFAKLDSAIKQTRNLSVFMVPDEEYPNATIISFKELFNEISRGKENVRIGMVGADQMPVSVYRQVAENFKGVELVDITGDFLRLRYVKSKWEIAQMMKAFQISHFSYLAMKKAINPGAREYEIAAAGEAIARAAGANGFAFKTIVASGKRSNAVVPTAMDKVMEDGETVMIGMAPRWNGYSGCFGDTLPVNGSYTQAQSECLKHIREVMRLSKEKLIPGNSGREIDVPGRAYFEKVGYIKYLVCPFVHTVGIMEAEAPFFGPNGSEEIVPGMTINIDVSFFGHPQLNGVRVETGYVITDKGPIPFCPETEKILMAE